MIWETRDLPVLRAIVGLSDEGMDYIEATEIAKRTGFDDDTVQNALWALAGEHPPFFSYEDGSTFDGRRIDAAHQPLRTFGWGPAGRPQAREWLRPPHAVDPRCNRPPECAAGADVDQHPLAARLSTRPWLWTKPTRPTN